MMVSHLTMRISKKEMFGALYFLFYLFLLCYLTFLSIFLPRPLFSFGFQYIEIRPCTIPVLRNHILLIRIRIKLKKNTFLKLFKIYISGARIRSPAIPTWIRITVCVNPDLGLSRIYSRIQFCCTKGIQPFYVEYLSCLTIFLEEVRRVKINY